jgi:hypothetical protein
MSKILRNWRLLVLLVSSQTVPLLHFGYCITSFLSLPLSRIAGSNWRLWFTGLQATVECKVNETAAFSFEAVDDKSVPRLYKTMGNETLPEGLSTSTTWYYGYLDEDMFSWASVYNNYSTSWFSFAAMRNSCTEGNWTSCHGNGFGKLQKTQCRLDFTARIFELSVDNVARTITVTPQNSIV